MEAGEAELEGGHATATLMAAAAKVILLVLSGKNAPYVAGCNAR